jgi:hypothetical protein
LGLFHLFNCASTVLDFDFRAIVDQRVSLNRLNGRAAMAVFSVGMMGDILCLGFHLWAELNPLTMAVISQSTPPCWNKDLPALTRFCQREAELFIHFQGISTEGP